MAKMTVSFPGNKKVDATMHGLTVHTDQPEKVGGDGTAPGPFSLFLASMATCTGFYALSFCQKRDLSTEGMELTLDTVKDPETRMITDIKMHLKTPEGFPEKYKNAILKSMNLCAVKKHLENPPKVSITTDLD